MHDTQIQILEAPAVEIVGTPENPTDHIQISFSTGIPLPVGLGRVLAITTGIYRIPMTSETAIETANQLLEAASHFPEPEAKPQMPSDFVIANNMQAASSIAQMDRDIRGK